MKYDLSKAHADYREVIPQIIDGLLKKYPRAALTQVYVGEPRNERDESMGYYDQDSKKAKRDQKQSSKMIKEEEIMKDPI